MWVRALYLAEIIEELVFTTMPFDGNPAMGDLGQAPCHEPDPTACAHARTDGRFLNISMLSSMRK